jgi:hypothetical protein
LLSAGEYLLCAPQRTWTGCGPGSGPSRNLKRNPTEGDRDGIRLVALRQNVPGTVTNGLDLLAFLLVTPELARSAPAFVWRIPAFVLLIIVTGIVFLALELAWVDYIRRIDRLANEHPYYIFLFVGVILAFIGACNYAWWTVVGIYRAVKDMGTSLSQHALGLGIACFLLSRALAFSKAWHDAFQ